MKGDSLGRYYTGMEVSQIFVNLFKTVHATSILDLGSGGGALSLAAARRWFGARIQTVDVDPSAQRLRTEISPSGNGGHEHLVADALGENLEELVGGARFDLGLCNPPYTRIPWRQNFSRILADASLDDLALKNNGGISSDILFIAQLLRLTRPGAEIGVIVPDGTVSGSRSEAVRKALLKRVSIRQVVQLPRGSFHDTEAQAYALFFRNEPGNGEEIEIRELGKGELCPPKWISHSQAALRMDYKYYRFPEDPSAGFTLRNIQADIARGGISSSQAPNCGYPVFHTCNFIQPDPLAYRLPGNQPCQFRPGWRIAGPGDILLARVDRKLHRKICLVSAGHALITDLIYRIRVPGVWQRKVVEAFLSEEGQTALMRASRGVGARMLNKEDLLDITLKTGRCCDCQQA